VGLIDFEAVLGRIFRVNILVEEIAREEVLAVESFNSHLSHGLLRSQGRIKDPVVVEGGLAGFA
jgi:hypothetical protein